MGRIRCSSRSGCCRCAGAIAVLGVRAAAQDAAAAGWRAGAGRCVVRAAALSWGARRRSNAGGALGAHQALMSWIPGFDFGLLLDPLSLLWTFIITGVGFLIHFYSIGYMDGDRAYRALLRLHELLRVRDADAGALRQLRRTAGRLGPRRPGLLLLDRVLVRTSVRGGGRAQGVRHQRRRRRRDHVRDLCDRSRTVHSIGFGDAFAAAGTFGHRRCSSRSASRSSSARPPSRRRFRCTPGCPTRWKARRPVSALIHAATMVTAGVYLIARCAPLWDASRERAAAGRHDRRHSPRSSARSSACAQWDIKRILAYSTMSQIGYMIMGVGVGAYEGGVAHFFTHAFFKAQLFLAAGSDHPRARERAGRSPDGRPAEEDAVRVLGDADRRAVDLRRAAVQRILLEGRK